MTRRFIVRGGRRSGKYITYATSPTLGRKYAWANVKTKAVLLTYEQARGVTRRYGGKLVAVV